VTAPTVLVTEEQATAVLHAVAAWMGKRGYGTLTHVDGTACADDERFGSCAAWRGADDQRYGSCAGHQHAVGPAPTGQEAAYRGRGPMLKMDWDWPGQPTPTVILEGGPYDWAIECCGEVQAELLRQGVPVFVEPYAGWALSCYPVGA
jgi:hypothetical protein